MNDTAALDPAPRPLRSEPSPAPPANVDDVRLFTLAVGVMALSFADAAMTLTLIGTGMVREWNPFLAGLIDQDLQLFANVKMGLTALGVWVLSATDRRLPCLLPARPILKAVFGAYCLVIVYHLTLFHRTGLLP